MQKAIIKVMLDITLDVDTDQPVTKLDPSVYQALREALEDRLHIGTWPLMPNTLGHYVDAVTVTAVQLLA